MSKTESEIYTRQPEVLQQQCSPEVVVFDTPEEVDEFAAAKLIQQIIVKPNSVLTLPTGNTPIGMYRRIVEAHRQGLNLRRVSIFNLDEYYPIDPAHPSSYAKFMKGHLIDHVPVDAWHIPNGQAEDANIEAQGYKELMEQHQPVDLAILGIGPGTTCHIGFNEKGSSIDSTVRYVPLDQETRAVNARLFDDPEEIPRGALTQGVSDILRAKRILVIAKGESKAWGINRTLNGPISSDAPASFLRLHPNVIFILDRAAAQYLNNGAIFSEKRMNEVNGDGPQAYGDGDKDITRS